MDKIGLFPVDSRHPNLALMKIARYHKEQGDLVEMFDKDKEYDKVYASKIFTFKKDYDFPIKAEKIEKGGTGYDMHKNLPLSIETLQPDYTLYPEIDNKTAYGFITRGCPNHCKWCVVPKKEGNIYPYMDVEEIAIEGRTNLILMDNNILASDYGLRQIEKAVKLGYKLDFNQAIDARLVTEDIARLLSKVKWLKYIRFGCDTSKQIEEVERAERLLRKYGYKKEIFLYCIILDDFKESFNRINHWRTADKINRFTPYGQPYRNFDDPNQVIPQWQKDLARWANLKWVYKSCEFKDFEPRKGFKCKTYFP